MLNDHLLGKAPLRVRHRSPLPAGTTSLDYKAANVELGNPVAMGILNPAKVIRLALKNAASIAGLVIATEQW